MDPKSEIREFLTSRRARITPEQAGLTVYGDNRRVPGLRREEVAMLAGVSADYYTQVERGNVNGVSDSVLDALVRALRLDDAERAHLFNLVRARRPTNPTRRRPPKQRVRQSVQQVLDAMTSAPAYVRDEYGDLVATNTLVRALYSQLFEGQDGPPNVARFVFLDPRATTFFVDWDEVAGQIVAAIHAQAGRDPYDRRLTDLIGELSTRSEIFRVRWAAQNVRHHNIGLKRFHHPVVGALDLNYDALPLPADPGLTLVTYTAQAGSRSEETLRLLGSACRSQPATVRRDRTDSAPPPGPHGPVDDRERRAEPTSRELGGSASPWDNSNSHSSPARGLLNDRARLRARRPPSNPSRNAEQTGDMRMERVTFPNAAIEVVGNLHKPADYDPDQKYPAVVVTHPFGAVKEQVSTRGRAEAGQPG